MAAEAQSGGCLCGAVRFHIAAKPRSVAYCHCRMCQQAGGAPVVPWVTVRQDQLVFDRGAPKLYRSSAKANRGFCGTCGTPLIFQYVDDATWIDITLSSFDRPEALPPEFHVWTSSAMPWLNIHDDLPRHPERGPFAQNKSE